MQKTPGTWYKVPVLTLLPLLASLAPAQITGVVNAASFLKHASLTPGSIISIFGIKLGNTVAYATDPDHLPLTLGGVTVTVGGVPSPLFYVSPTQVNAQISPAVKPGTASVVLTSPLGTYTHDVTIATPGTPGLFTFSGSGTRDGAVLNCATFARGPFTVTTGGAPTCLAIYVTGLDLSTAPTVTIDGVAVTVAWYGNTVLTGLQQINVLLPATLAGAGRVEVAVISGAKTSNIGEIVLLPNPGSGQSAPHAENAQRNRELAAVAWVPGTHTALLTDENDDVVRVLDVAGRAVKETIALPDGSEPVAVAVNAAGTLAAVGERDRGMVAVIDLAHANVAAEIAVGAGPIAIAIFGDRAAVVCQDTDEVWVVNLVSGQAEGKVTVGRGPRSVAIDVAANLAYVANQDDGTISVIDLATRTVVKTITLDSQARPHAIALIPTLKMAVVTLPSAGNQGQAVLLSIPDGAQLASFGANPDKSGGSSEIAVLENTVYFANQSSASVTVASVSAGPPASVSSVVVKVDIGARALAIDPLDNVLLVTNQGSGTVVLVDLSTQHVVGAINGVRGEHETGDDAEDTRDDHDHAGNLPVIAGFTPAAAKAGSTFPFTITGTNLGQASAVLFLDPDSLPGKRNGNGKGNGNGNSGNHGHGPFGTPDPAFTVTAIHVNAAGTQLDCTVAIKATATVGDRAVRVITPNGDATSAMTFKVQ